MVKEAFPSYHLTRDKQRGGWQLETQVRIAPGHGSKPKQTH